MKTILFRLCFVFVAALFSVQYAFAVPAVPWPVEIQQPDGTKITVRIKGDEKVHWMESPDGYTLMYDTKKNVVYAELNPEGNMMPSSIKYGYGEPSLRSSTGEPLRKGLRYSSSQVHMLKQIWEVAAVQNASQSAAPATAAKKVLLILMDFSDRPFTKTKADFEALANQPGYSVDGAQGSVKDFYAENSYGQLDLITTVAGPYRAAKTAAYYAANSRVLANEAATKAADQLNLQDYATNGVLETFHIIFAGYGAETGLSEDEYIWSHKTSMNPITLDGVKVSVFSCSPELRGSSGTNLTRIGVICHELGHVFGSPDYYDTNNETGGSFAGTGQWDLMANGSWNNSGITPGHINMYQKIRYGWVTPIELTSCTPVNNMLNSAQNPVAYTYKAHANGEMYVLENRQKTGFDAYVPGHGLLIWHVHQVALGGNGSNATHPQNLYPVVASSPTAIPNASPSSYGDVNSVGTPFPGSSGKTAFTDLTVPQAFTWQGLQGIGKPVTNISESDGKISFTFMQNGLSPVANLQATVNGVNVSLSWTAPLSSAPTGYRIYRNDVLQYTISKPGTTTHQQISVPNGNYTYCVSAVYDILESEKECVDADVTAGSGGYCLPVTNLTAAPAPDKVRLNWTEPENSTWLNIADNPASASGTSSAFEIAVKWTSSELAGKTGFQIKKVNFADYGANSYSKKVVVYKVLDGNAQKVCDQPITQTLNGDWEYNEVILETPVTIEASYDYYIGLSFSGGGNFVYDNKTGGNPKNMFRFGSSAWGTLSAAGLNNDLCFKAYIENPATVSAYTVYKDYQPIGTTQVNTYLDSNVDPETEYSYCVVAEYTNECSSEPVCTEAATGRPINPNPVKNLQLTTTGTNDKDVQLTWQMPDAHTGKNLQYCNSVGSAYHTGANDVIFAVRFTPAEMQSCAGLMLSKIRFYVTPDAISSNTDFTIKVWTGGNGSAPREEIHSQSAGSYSTAGWKEISLSTPVTPDIYEDLWIGVLAHKEASGTLFVLPFLGGENVTGKGDMLYVNGSWTTATSYFDNNLNWSLFGILEPIGVTGYQVLRNKQEIAVVDNPNTLTYTNSDPGKGRYEYCVKALYSTQKSDPVCGNIAVGEVIWNGLASSDWTAAGNWENGVCPTASSTVVIPSGAGHFPVLNASATVNEIYFQPGAEIGRQDRLTYNKAHIALDFSGNPGSLTRGQWHLLSMPLDQVYAGDFIFGGYPTTSLQKYSAESGIGEWISYSYTEFNQHLSRGQGFALKIHTDSDTGSGIDEPFGEDLREYGLGKVSGIIQLPYHEHPEHDASHRIHQWDGSQSHFYPFYYKEDGKPLAANLKVSATRNNGAYKLWSETTFSLPVDFGQGTNSDHFALVGNPYMSTIDFDAFYTANSGKIKNNYHVLRGNAYASYTQDGYYGVLPLSRYIAPVQAFFVEKSSGTSGSVSLSFNIADLSATDHASGTGLYTPLSDPPSSKLNITADNGMASILTFIAQRDYGRKVFSDADSRKFLDGIGDVPEIYTLKESGNELVPVGSNIINTDELLIPLGLSTTYQGNMRFSFDGMNRYNARIAFLDLAANREIDLTGLDSYEYPFKFVPPVENGEAKAENNRFFIRIQKTSTGIEPVQNLVYVYGKQGRIYAVAGHTNRIRQIDVYNSQGQLLHSEDNIYASSHAVTLNTSYSGVYIVRLTTEQGVKSVKLLMNK